MIPFPFQAAGAGMVQQPGAGGSASLSSLISADSPAYWFRHAEASGTTMKNEVGADGAYLGSGVALGSAALYSGGPKSVRIPAVAGSGYGQKAGGTLPSLTAMTLMTIVKFTSLDGVYRGLLSCDSGASDRMWQWRMIGATMEFVRIANFVGPTETIGFSTGFSTGTPYMVHLVITTGGAVTFYVNGVSAYTTTITPANFGSVTEFLQVGFMSGGGGAYANAFFSETALFPAALSGARVAAHAAAAGF